MLKKLASVKIETIDLINMLIHENIQAYKNGTYLTTDGDFVLYEDLKSPIKELINDFVLLQYDQIDKVPYNCVKVKKAIRLPICYNVFDTKHIERVHLMTQIHFTLDKTELQALISNSGANEA